MRVVMELPCTSHIPQYFSQFNDQCEVSLLIGMEATNLPYIYPQLLVN